MNIKEKDERIKELERQLSEQKYRNQTLISEGVSIKSSSNSFEEIALNLSAYLRDIK